MAGKPVALTYSVAGVWMAEGKVLLGRRKPGGSMGGRWELPGGKCENGENERQALAREFLEEFGLNIRVIEKLASTRFSNRGHPHEVTAYRIEASLPIPRLNEHDEVSWFTAHELPRDIVDSDAALLAKIL